MFPRRTCLLTITLIAMGAAFAVAAEPVRVRVLTYNIHHGEGTDGKLDLERIASVIRRVQPDLVALQEVDVGTRRSQGVDQAAELGRLTRMQAAFGKAMDYAGGQYGEALLSRYPLKDVKVHELPFTPGCEPRCAVAARIRLGTDGPELLFAGTHLEHAQAALRLCQAGKLAPALVAGNNLPAILAGDFNAEPDSPPIRVLLPHWTDATADKSAPTWPADVPTAKIDYVFFRPADRWRVVQTQVVDERIASDHRPLLVVLEWKEPRSPP
jgi:endonuclease/exonuclease/phosphatase family metal-dependent hydrolase